MTNARDHVLRYAYHPWGGLEQVEHFADAQAETPDRAVSYTYDVAGNLRSTSDTELTTAAPAGGDPALEPAGRLYTFGYDPLDRVEEVAVHYVPGGDRTLASAYDRFGHRSGLTVTDGTDVLSHGWLFDDLDRLVEATLAGGTTTFAYRANDELETITRSSGVATTYGYHPHGPLETLTVRDATSQLLLGLTYTVDAVLNVDTVSEDRPSVSGALFDYGYDGVDRLIEAALPTALGLPALEAFAYDAAGNREDPGDPNLYAYDANNRITASPSKAWAFDADGNVATRNAGLADEERFTFDKINRLRRYESDATGVDATYLYDPFGRRIRKTVNGATTWFLWDGDQLLAEHDGAGARTRRYAYAGGFAPLELAEGATAATEAVYAVDADHLDTPRLLTDASGQPVWRASLQAFGQAAVDPASTVDFPIRFPGQYFDAESGLSYNRFRYYDPVVGRYLNADPLGQIPLALPLILRAPDLSDDAEIHVYGYGKLDPINRSDPLGTRSALHHLLCSTSDAKSTSSTLGRLGRLQAELNALREWVDFCKAEFDLSDAQLEELRQAVAERELRLLDEFSRREMATATDGIVKSFLCAVVP